MVYWCVIGSCPRLKWLSNRMGGSSRGLLVCLSNSFIWYEALPNRNPSKHKFES